MEIGSLKKESFEAWVPFGKDAEVLVRYVPREELQEIKKKATIVAWDRKHQKEEKFDPLAADLLLGKAAVRGWRGFTADGAEFPWSPESCDLLMRKWTEFARFVNETCADLEALMDEERARKTKNLSLTSGRASTIRV
jgi:hypothetical protein